MDKLFAARVDESFRTEIRAVITSALVACVAISGSAAHALPPEPGKGDLAGLPAVNMPLEFTGSFATLYEPSGIVPLSDGRFLIVEDEPDRALRLVSARVSTDNTMSLADESRLERPSSLTERLFVGELDDLEGAAHDQMQRFYVISSHDDSAPHWSSKRQKLLRFSIQDGRMQDVARKLTLRRDLLTNYPPLAENAKRNGKKKAVPMNFEALAYDRKRDVLLIGFRAPVLDGKAIIVRLLNPDAYLDDVARPELDKALWTVDLDKGGLRAMTYDDQTDQLLLISRREDHKNDSYKLWRLPADGQEPAVRIKVDGKKDRLDRVEGLAHIDLYTPSGSGVLFVRDNGDAKKGRGADWFVLSREELGLDY